MVVIAVITSSMVVIVERRRGTKLRVFSGGIEVAIIDGGIIVVAHHNVGIEEARKGRSRRGKEDRDFERYYGVLQKGSIDTAEAL